LFASLGQEDSGVQLDMTKHLGQEEVSQSLLDIFGWQDALPG
jgi:hypothetical protein